jgi:glycosyltransferase involved in cell wall biosynthesis
MCAVMEDGMKLLALVDSPDHVCCRYRIKAFEPAMRGSGWSVSYEGLERGSLFRSFQLRRAGESDAVVLQRKLLPTWQLRILRRAARYLVFDFDDAVVYRDSYDPRGPHSRWRSRRFAETVQTVDTIVAGNDFLADTALRAGASAERVHVIPTCVEPRLYPVARHAESAGSVDLVWIGSSSTLRGLEESLPIWEHLAKSLPQLRLRVICDRFPGPFPLPIMPVRWDERTEAKALAAGAIGVSWLPDDPWSRGKCGLKILQYQAAGLPVVANPVGTQCEMIRAGETGYLATTQGEWAEAVTRLASDPRLRARMGSAARRSVEAGYSVPAWEETFVASMTGSSRTAICAGWVADRQALADIRPRFASRARKSYPTRALGAISER